jgi:hypothetical protein
MRSKANEAIANIFIGANVAPKILLTSNNSLFGTKIYNLLWKAQTSSLFLIFSEDRSLELFLACRAGL